MSRFLSAAAAAGAALAAALSFASSGAAPASVVVTASAPTSTGFYQTRAATVSYADVDLVTAQGAATLFDRIDAAARVVCGERAGRTMDSARAKQFNTCRAQTTAAAVHDLNNPQLTQIATSR